MTDSHNLSEEIDLRDKIVKITGKIKGETPKALLIDVNNGEENWFPKSVILKASHKDCSQTSSLGRS